MNLFSLSSPPLSLECIGSFLKAMLYSGTMVLKLEPASESPGRLAKTQIAGSHIHPLSYRGSGMRLENVHL